MLAPTSPPQFHDRAVVASLKLEGSQRNVRIGGQFHDRAVVASLKPPCWRTGAQPPVPIPRPRGRGLIEAVRAWRPDVSWSQFHDRAVVASLKPRSRPR